jgi:hypothetical protein
MVADLIIVKMYMAIQCSLKWGTTVKGKIYYVNSFSDNTGNHYSAIKISSSQIPAFPAVPSFPALPTVPTAPSPPEIKTFPGIPNVAVTDYKGKPETKVIRLTDLDADGRLNMAKLSAGVYYVDDTSTDSRLTNLQIYGKYSGVISLVSSGEITVNDHVTRTNPSSDALMILSFKNGDTAIHINWKKTVDALLFAPTGTIDAEDGEPTINGVSWQMLLT